MAKGVLVMVKRFSMVFLTMLLAIIAALIAAKHPTGPNTISFDEPGVLWLSVGMLAALFLPPLILSLFNNFALKIISAIYQAFIVLAFLILIPLGFVVPDGGFWVSFIGIAGTIISICSILVTILSGWKKGNMVVD